jgi:hypothetical protein
MWVDSGVHWKKLLASITGSVDQELLLRNEIFARGEPNLKKSTPRASPA